MKKIEVLALAIISIAALSFAFAPASDAAGDARLEVESVTESVGASNTEVRIELTSNPGIWGLKAEISYDSHLKLVGVESGGIMEVEVGPFSNPYYLYCDNGGGKDTSVTGTLVVLKFEISSGATGRFDISANNIDAVNYGEEQVEFDSVAGGVSIGVVTKVILDPPSLRLAVGGTSTLTATVYPTDAVNKKVTWSSSNPNVASVSNGVVTAKSAGTAYIIVETDDGGFTDRCNVYVATDVVPVSDVTISDDKVSLSVGDSRTLTATVQPSDASDKKVSWSSSNPSVAIVTSAGKVTAVSAGTSIITVTTDDGGKTDTCTVTVADSPAPSPSGGGSNNTLLYVGIATAVLVVILVAIFVMRSRGSK